MDFEIIDPIHDIETVAVNTSIRDLDRLKKMYGNGWWRKLKGIARVRLSDGAMCEAELHWYEAHGIGKREMKIKKLLLNVVALTISTCIGLLLCELVARCTVAAMRVPLGEKRWSTMRKPSARISGDSV